MSTPLSKGSRTLRQRGRIHPDGAAKIGLDASFGPDPTSLDRLQPKQRDQLDRRLYRRGRRHERTRRIPKTKNIAQLRHLRRSVRSYRRASPNLTRIDSNNRVQTTQKHSMKHDRGRVGKVEGNSVIQGRVGATVVDHDPVSESGGLVRSNT